MHKVHVTYLSKNVALFPLVLCDQPLKSNAALCEWFQVESFNLEEEAFGWQTTSYPDRVKTINMLKPYHQLYELTVDFNDKYKYV